MRSHRFLPNSAADPIGPCQWKLPQIRLDMSAVWDVADGLAAIVGQPVQVLDALHRPIERGKESGLSSSQLAVVYVHSPPHTPAPGQGLVATPTTMTGFAAFSVRGGSIGLGGQENVIRQHEEAMKRLLTQLQADSAYRWGPVPALAGAFVVVAVVLAVCGSAAGALAARSGHGLAIVPLIAAGVLTVLVLLGRAAWTLGIRLLETRRGQLVSGRPRHEIARERENRRASLRDQIRGGVITLLLGGAAWVIVHVLLRIPGT